MGTGQARNRQPFSPDSLPGYRSATNERSAGIYGHPAPGSEIALTRIRYLVERYDFSAYLPGIRRAGRHPNLVLNGVIKDLDKDVKHELQPHPPAKIQQDHRPSPSDGRDSPDRVESHSAGRHPYGLLLPLEVRYDEFTVDIAENQILRAACERVLKVPGVADQSKMMLRRVLREFTDVTPLARRDPIPAWPATRLNVRYHSALRLAELVLRATSFEHAPGDVAVTGFLLDMPVLFEGFVTMALGDALVSAFGGRICPQDWHDFDELGRVRLRPDLVWKIAGVPVAVVDAKYKSESPAGYPNADLYQLLAYCTVLGLRHGHLVYAKGDSEPARHTTRRSGVEIHCDALDLAADPVVLLDQIRELAGKVGACMARGYES